MPSYPNELPDDAALQQLANLYFKALPGDYPADTFSVPDLQSGSLQHTAAQGGNAVQPDERPEYTGYAPSSVAGSGASASAIEHDRSFNLNAPPTSHPDPHFGTGKVPQSVAGSGVSPSADGRENIFHPGESSRQLPEANYSGQIPSSVAGSGVSPSAIQHSKTFNLDAPPTSHPDPHFAGTGQVPSSVAGSGISPSYAQQGQQTPALYAFGEQQNNSRIYNPLSAPLQTHSAVPTSPSFGYLPYAEQPFEADLQQLLGGIKSYVPSAQIPGTAYSAPNATGFYFLPEEPSLSKDYSAYFVKDVPSKETYTGLPKPPFDVNIIKQDFPILQERVNGRQLIWLDNAATTQKPRQVIDRVSYFYEHENSNIHRAAHELAARATDAYEAARQKAQRFLNAKSPNEIVFVRGSTEAINLVAQSWGDQHLQPGDEIIVSHLEHHANIVPWQLLAGKKGLKLKVIPVDDDGQVILEEYGKLLGPKVKLVSFTQVSNALGTVTPAKKMVEMAHAIGARVLVDGAQAVSHLRADVTYLDCDWYVFSGHKVFGPTGIGVLYGKEALLNETQPWQGGGNMIQDVTFEQTKFHNAPSRFEAGTGNIADAVGLGAAIDYVTRIGMDNIHQYEHYLLIYATHLLKQVPGLRLIGTAADKAGVLSFVLDGFKTEEVGSYLNQHYAIAVRSGHHCAQPILRRFGVEATVRPSLALYNTCSDIDTLVTALHRLKSGQKQR